MLLRGFATADASSLIEEAAFFEDLFLPNGRFDAGNHCNENTGVKPSFVSSRRILRLVIGDKAKRLCVVSERRSRRRVSVPHRVSADSRRRKYISTSHDQPRQSLFGSLVGT